MTVKNIDKNDDSSESVRVRKAKGQALQPLKFWDLHERDFWVHPPPFLRALFLKARMAWRKHKEDDFPLPDPVQFAERFSGFCDKWNDFMVGKLLGSIQQMNSAGGTQSRNRNTFKRLFHRQGEWRKTAISCLRRICQANSRDLNSLNLCY